MLVKWNVAEAKHEAMAPRLGDVVEDIHVSDETIVARLADGTAHSFDTQLKIQGRTDVLISHIRRVCQIRVSSKLVQ